MAFCVWQICLTPGFWGKGTLEIRNIVLWALKQSLFLQWRMASSHLPTAEAHLCLFRGRTNTVCKDTPKVPQICLKRRFETEFLTFNVWKWGRSVIFRVNSLTPALNKSYTWAEPSEDTGLICLAKGSWVILDMDFRRDLFDFSKTKDPNICMSQETAGKAGKDWPKALGSSH